MDDFLLVQLGPLYDALPQGLAPGLMILCLSVITFPNMKKAEPWGRVLIVSVSLCLTLQYIVWRLLDTLPPMDLSLGYILGLAFILIEGVEAIRSIVFMIFLSRTRDRSPDVDANIAWLEKLEAPLVDVFICTYNEESDILERTIVGALALDYANFRLWVLDDGKRPWLKQMCRSLGCGYLTRVDNSHAKAGNINSALRYVNALENKPDFVAVLDADFVCTPAFLTRTLTLFKDPSVGVVQTPQHFFNSDPIQSNLSLSNVWPDEQRLFFDIIMPSKDAWGLAICCGTSSVIKAEALTRIDGVPVDSVTEDYLLTLRLKEVGYKTIYLNEPLTVGLAPEGLQEYLTQRGRWCLGLVQIIRGQSGPLRNNMLSLIDRIALLEGFLGWTSTNLLRVTGILVPPLYLLFGVRVVSADSADLASHFLPYYLWQTATMVWISSGRVLPIMSDVCQLVSCPAVFKAIASGLLNPKNRRFKVTAKGGDRSASFVEWPLLRLFLGLLAFTMAGLVFYANGVRGDDTGTGALAFGWSWYNVLVLSLACVTCFERPRRRKAERFPTDEPITIIHEGAIIERSVRDISVGGARISGRCPGAKGDTLVVRYAGLEMRAVIVRCEAENFAVCFEQTPEIRAVLIRRVYSGRYAKPLEIVRPLAVGRAVLARILA